MIATLLVLAPTLGTAIQEQLIRVSDSASGCEYADARDYVWRLQGDAYQYQTRRLSVADVERIRGLVLAARQEPADLLAQIGFTPESLLAHRSEILKAILPASHRGGKSKALPAELESLFSYDRLAPLVTAELKGLNWRSTSSFHFSVTLPGEPVVEVSSQSEVPWMLPWTIRVGQEEWQIADIAVTKAMARLADAQGPCSHLLDGTAYWNGAFWTDGFWERFVGEELDAAVSGRIYAQLAGYAEFAARFDVERVITGSVNMLPESMYLEVRSREPGPIDGARWWNLLEDREPAHDFHAFLRAFDSAASQVQRRAWLLDWKSAGPERSLGVDIVGGVPHSEERMDFFVDPAWIDAGFTGSPEIEVLLRERLGAPRGTVFLSSAEDGALIVNAWPGSGSHWFDALDVHFHPRAKPPTYARVDAQGKVEVRTLE